MSEKPYHPYRRDWPRYKVRTRDEAGVLHLVFVPENKLDMTLRAWPAVEAVHLEWLPPAEFLQGNLNAAIWHWDWYLVFDKITDLLKAAVYMQRYRNSGGTEYMETQKHIDAHRMNRIPQRT